MDLAVGLVGQVVAVALVAGALLVVLGRREVGTKVFWKSLVISVVGSLLLSFVFNFLGNCQGIGG